MLESRLFKIGGIALSGMLLFASCEQDRNTSFTRCEYDNNPQSTGDEPIYLRENRIGTNYELTLGENKFLRNPDTGVLEWIVKGVKQEMFPDNEIIVFDNHTGRTADLTISNHEKFIKVDITTECNSNKPQTPVLTTGGMLQDSSTQLPNLEHK